jgi:hypothetical protein
LAGGRKLIESVIIAVITSTGVYLVGSIYTEAYFGRMSIDAVALDLPPPYIALQATHAVQSLLVYPVVLGAGARLFPEGTAKTSLTLAAHEAFENGVLHLTYAPAG